MSRTLRGFKDTDLVIKQHGFSRSHKKLTAQDTDLSNSSPPVGATERWMAKLAGTGTVSSPPAVAMTCYGLLASYTRAEASRNA